MRTSSMGWAVLAAAALCWTPAVRAQEPQALVPGMNQERTLGPGENHVYTITLQEGAALLGEADQHGVDLVIDEYAPDGKLLRTVDSPNGTEGPEPIDVIALQAGAYKLVIHTLDPNPKPGKYVMKIDRVLSLEENGERLAEKNYPPGLQDLWRAYRTDPKAVEAFVASRKGKGPIIEDLKDDPKSVEVTYLYYGDEHTEKVTTSSGPHGGQGGILMQRFLQTPLFFATEIVPKDARYRYGFTAIETRFLGPGNDIQVSEDVFAADALNPKAYGGLSVLSLPDAPAQPYVVKRDSVPAGKLTPATLKSLALKEDRTLTVYTPPGYEGGKACELLIVFDGEIRDGQASDMLPVPTILDNLLAAKKIPPTIAVFVNNMGRRNRDLTDSAPFADFIGKELVPWARTNYRIGRGPSHVVVTGSSFGGLAAAYSAFMHPEAIGNVLSQSGSYWVTKDWQSNTQAAVSETGDLVGQFRESKRLPIRFYLEVGRFEPPGSMLGTNRELRDVLLLKGYPVTYREFDGGHDAISWRGSIADGLIALLGQKNR